MKRFLACAALTVGSFLTGAARAETLSLTEKAIVIDDGADGKINLNYPKFSDKAKKRGSISKTTLNDDKTKATLEYTGGGKAELDISDGNIKITVSDVPDNTAHIYVNAILPLSLGEGGKFSLGKESKEFPKEKGETNLAQGSATSFTVIRPGGARTIIGIEPFSFQQLQDGRAYSTQGYNWQGWMPVYPERNTYTIRIGEKALAAAPPAPAAPAAPAKPSVPPIENVPQKPVVDAAVGTSVQKWKDAKRVGFYLSFDDACPTHLTNVIPELQKRKIVGTFYVIAGTGLFKDRPQWREVTKSPYVVLANHTMTHKDFPDIEKFEQELVDANKVIEDYQPGGGKPRLISFGKPGGVKYGITDAQIREVLVKHNNLYRLPFWGGGTHVKTIPEMQAYFDNAIRKGDTNHLDFHGVGGDWLKVDLDFFHAMLDKIEANNELMWISDAATIQKYAAERVGAQVKVEENSADKIRLSVTTNVDTALYDVPLTLATKVPAGWRSVNVVQGETKTTVPVKDGVAMYDALPTGTEVVLTAGE